VRGATGQAPSLDDLADGRQDWRTTDLGRDLVEYVEGQTLEHLPSEPEHPAVASPVIPVTDIDTGANSLSSTTIIQASSTIDIIDQVSRIDPQDIFTVSRNALNDTDFSVLDGEVSVTYMNASGEVLQTQVLGRGSHKLQAPVTGPDDITLKIEAGNSSSATYMVYGFESTAPEPFKIDLEFDSSLTASQQQILAAAAKNVASLIDQGLPTAIVDGS
jgi:hypothetical protein